jgi:lipoprotein signal peptidase
MSPLLRRWLVLLATVLVVLFIDQLTKRIVIDTMSLGQSRQPVAALAPFFQLTRSENRGSAFGFLPQAGDLFLMLAIVIVIGLFIFFPRLPEHARLSRFAFGLICGGALGNALDRFEYGVVIDFIHYTIPGLISNVSNLADHAIVLGVIMLLFESWRSEPAPVTPATSTDSPESST